MMMMMMMMMMMIMMVMMMVMVVMVMMVAAKEVAALRDEVLISDDGNDEGADAAEDVFVCFLAVVIVFS